MSRVPALLVVLIALLSACDNSGGQVVSEEGATAQRHKDAGLVASGGELYAQHCATCHGTRAEGDPDWRRKDADGMYPPPPLNGSGHAWHHPQQMLHDMIKFGSSVDESGHVTGHMPAWNDKLSDQQIDAIIAWFQSLWSDQVYAIWYDQQQPESGH